MEKKHAAFFISPLTSRVLRAETETRYQLSSARIWAKVPVQVVQDTPYREQCQLGRVSDTPGQVHLSLIPPRSKLATAVDPITFVEIAIDTLVLQNVFRIGVSLWGRHWLC